jgi:hypothetical protein
MEEGKPLRVAIVGEGPTGLMCIAKLLSSMHTESPKVPLEISWFKYRDVYVRRHVVNISKNFLEHIEKILTHCDRCIGKDSDALKDQLSMSIRTLEYVMNEHVEESPDFKMVKSRGGFNYEKDVAEFDHVFFCDGANSKGRQRVMFSGGEPFEPILYRYDEPIVILYSGLGPLKIAEGWTPRNNMNSKKIFLTQPTVEPYGGNLQAFYDLISILYNIRKNSASFGFDAAARDLWATGYETFKELTEILTEVGAFLNSRLEKDPVEKLLGLLKEQGAYISEAQESLLESLKKDPALLDGLLATLFEVVQANIKTDKNIILSPVLPKIQTYGVAFGSSPALRYARRIGDTSCYLLGDSASAFPPGFSLEISLVSADAVMEAFYSTFCLDIYKAIQSPAKKIDCRVRSASANSKFWGGYPVGNRGNSFPKSLGEIKRRVTTQYKPEGGDFIVQYNRYSLEHFIYTASSILCRGGYQLGGLRRAAGTRRLVGKRKGKGTRRRH